MNFSSSCDDREPSRSARCDEVWRRPPFRAAIASLAFAAALLLVRTAGADCTHSISKQILGVPIWSTSPNEGNTWGAMPILLGICPDDHHTSWLLAPSVTWNSSIHYTGTARWFQYPDPDSTLTVIISGSTHVNFVLYGAWQHLPTAEGEYTDETVLRVDRSLFARFFGIGPDTPQSAETSYTLFRAFFTERRGITSATISTSGYGRLRARWRRRHRRRQSAARSRGVPGRARHARCDAAVAGHRSALRHAPRSRLLRSRRARAAVGAIVEGISNSPTFVRGGFQASVLWPEIDRLAGAARVSWRGVSSSSAPFYQQSELGGSMYLRGFEEGRFYDRQAWTVEVEQRVRLLRTTLMGVTADWRIDPFVTAGQVFGDWSQIASKPQIAAGVGMRVFVTRASWVASISPTVAKDSRCTSRSAIRTELVRRLLLDAS